MVDLKLISGRKLFFFTPKTYVGVLYACLGLLVELTCEHLGLDESPLVGQAPSELTKASLIGFLAPRIGFTKA